MMSAIETIIEKSTGWIKATREEQEAARAELDALREENLKLSAGNYLLNEIGAALNCAPDATILQRIAELIAHSAPTDPQVALDDSEHFEKYSREYEAVTNSTPRVTTRGNDARTK